MCNKHSWLCWQSTIIKAEASNRPAGFLQRRAFGIVYSGRRKLWGRGQGFKMKNLCLTSSDQHSWIQVVPTENSSSREEQNWKFSIHKGDDSSNPDYFSRVFYLEIFFDLQESSLPLVSTPLQTWSKQMSASGTKVVRYWKKKVTMNLILANLRTDKWWISVLTRGLCRKVATSFICRPWSVDKWLVKLMWFSKFTWCSTALSVISLTCIF